MFGRWLGARHDAVATAKKFGFSGWSLDVEPTVQPPGSGEACMAEYT